MMSVGFTDAASLQQGLTRRSTEIAELQTPEHVKANFVYFTPFLS